MTERNECGMSEIDIIHWSLAGLAGLVGWMMDVSNSIWLVTDEPDVLLGSDEPI
jgi:hypothetical protein